jgi:hypothetical protein
LATIDSGDLIATQVTTKFLAHRHPIELGAASFAAGSLQKKSFVLPGKLFTAHRSVIVKRRSPAERDSRGRDPADSRRLKAKRQVPSHQYRGTRTQP